ncbi:gamma carbonic anhydrase family protein [Babesia caballi]|uniref:Gamma carbonic anhydrase family protein n=1 Tax=Babesia caballi TaxID=5871 RepID=A0AAV4LWI4_BABCB|nr:gamma carbonic anhydrase family protein [Babesia caballi]
MDAVAPHHHLELRHRDAQHRVLAGRVVHAAPQRPQRSRRVELAEDVVVAQQLLLPHAAALAAANPRNQPEPAVDAHPEHRQAQLAADLRDDRPVVQLRQLRMDPNVQYLHPLYHEAVALAVVPDVVALAVRVVDEVLAVLVGHDLVGDLLAAALRARVHVVPGGQQVADDPHVLAHAVVLHDVHLEGRDPLLRVPGRQRDRGVGQVHHDGLLVYQLPEGRAAVGGDRQAALAEYALVAVAVRVRAAVGRAVVHVRVEHGVDVAVLPQHLQAVVDGPVAEAEAVGERPNVTEAHQKVAVAAHEVNGVVPHLHQTHVAPQDAGLGGPCDVDRVRDVRKVQGVRRAGTVVRTRNPKELQHAGKYPPPRTKRVLLRVLLQLQRPRQLRVSLHQVAHREPRRPADGVGGSPVLVHVQRRLQGFDVHAEAEAVHRGALALQLQREAHVHLRTPRAVHEGADEAVVLLHYGVEVVVLHAATQNVLQRAVGAQLVLEHQPVGRPGVPGVDVPLDHFVAHHGPEEVAVAPRRESVLRVGPAAAVGVHAARPPPVFRQRKQPAPHGLDEQVVGDEVAGREQGVHDGRQKMALEPKRALGHQDLSGGRDPPPLAQRHVVAEHLREAREDFATRPQPHPVLVHPHVPLHELVNQVRLEHEVDVHVPRGVDPPPQRVERGQPVGDHDSAVEAAWVVVDVAVAVQHVHGVDDHVAAAAVVHVVEEPGERLDKGHVQVILGARVSRAALYVRVVLRSDVRRKAAGRRKGPPRQEEEKQVPGRFEVEHPAVRVEAARGRDVCGFEKESEPAKRHVGDGDLVAERVGHNASKVLHAVLVLQRLLPLFGTAAPGVLLADTVPEFEIAGEEAEAVARQHAEPLVARPPEAERSGVRLQGEAASLTRLVVDWQPANDGVPSRHARLDAIRAVRRYRDILREQRRRKPALAAGARGEDRVLAVAGRAPRQQPVALEENVVARAGELRELELDLHREPLRHLAQLHAEQRVADVLRSHVDAIQAHQVDVAAGSVDNLRVSGRVQRLGEVEVGVCAVDGDALVPGVGHRGDREGQQPHDVARRSAVLLVLVVRVAARSRGVRRLPSAAREDEARRAAERGARELERHGYILRAQIVGVHSASCAMCAPASPLKRSAFHPSVPVMASWLPLRRKRGAA